MFMQFEHDRAASISERDTKKLRMEERCLDAQIERLRLQMEMEERNHNMEERKQNVKIMREILEPVRSTREKR